MFKTYHTLLRLRQFIVLTTITSKHSLVSTGLETVGEMGDANVGESIRKW